MNGCHIKPEQFFNLIFGYNGQYQERSGDTNMPEVSTDENLSAVPAGEIWVINCIWGKNDNKACNIHLKIVCGANIHTIKFETTAAALAVCSVQGAFVLAAGDYVRITFANPTAGDDCYWGALGYKMKVSQ